MPELLISPETVNNHLQVHRYSSHLANGPSLGSEVEDGPSVAEYTNTSTYECSQTIQHTE